MANSTEHEIQLLAAFGSNSVIQIRRVVAQMVVFGAYAILVALTCRSILARPRKTFWTWTLLGAVLLPFSMIAAVLGMAVKGLILDLEAILVNNLEQSVVDRFEHPNRDQLHTKKLIINIPINILWNLNGGAIDCGLPFLINDALAAWRALVLWKEDNATSRYVAWALRVLLGLTFLMFIPAQVVMHVVTVRNLNSSVEVVGNSVPSTILSITASALSIASNAVATAMLAYTAYQYRAFEAKNGFKINSARILVFFAESGFIYMLMQIIRVAFNVLMSNDEVHGSLHTGILLFQDISVILCAMFTPALILIVNYGYSLADTCIEINADSGAAGGIAFKERARPVRTLSNLVFGSRAGAMATDTTDSTGQNSDSTENVGLEEARDKSGG
ncbi:hypothetical protein BDV98DRAFT_659448 [Pterulicium gracile]|uniref:Organic solute transporter Ostalpha-domain-containing protein n=1 Tax=Pterulicium gracile TaxID=1884261 RepID=A0A5C3Q4I4_9AGAR|nr:hypothetical protein BDV98DRAFT_659448 [Pterula gracilis]